MPQRGGPHNRRDYLRLGYTMDRVVNCRSCKVPVELWKTHKGKDVLFDITPNQNEASQVRVHFDTCPKRKDRDAAPDPNEARRRNATRCRQATNALAVLVVYGDGEWAGDVDPSLSAEDLRHELITGANLFKRAVEGR